MVRFAMLMAASLAALSSTAALADDDGERIDFERQIRPLLVMHCGECHGPKTQKSDLRLDAKKYAFEGGLSGEAIVPKDSEASELIRRIESDDEDERMPPSKPLAAQQIALLKRWIDSGARWPESDYDREAAKDPRREHWAFQPVRKVEPPQDATGRGLTNPIDRFIAKRLAENSLGFSSPASRRTLIRRASFDLLGLPPTPDAVDAFVQANDPDAAWRELVDRLLASPRYGERWAQHWLDIVRYADTHGFEVNTPRENAWPYRDYVIRAFNEDMPYDRFVIEQLAGDSLGADDATGFLVAAAVLLPGQIGKDEESKRLARQDALDEIVVGSSATFLGMTIGCARCHDHKFDPITQQDYYSLQAFFAGVDYGDRPMRNAEQRSRLAKAKELGRRVEQLEAMLRKLEPLRHAGRTLFIDEEDKRFVDFLKKENGPGANPVGTKPGYRDDPGDAKRLGNISGGRYTWWNNIPGEDVAAYRPSVAGRFHLWLSWGVHGSGVHTRDARYVLDRDGDLATRQDQRELAKVDQYYPAGVTEGETEKTPQWSGLLDAGVVELQGSSKILLRGGETGTGITADVIVLQEAMDEDASESRLPHLRAPLNPRRNVERFVPVEARFIRFTTMETIDNNKHEPCIDELEIFGVDDPERNLALASLGAVPTASGNYSDTGRHQLRHVNDGRYGNDRSWISNEHGGGWVQIELPEAARINRVVWGRDRNGKFPDRLAVRYRIDASMDGKTWTAVAGHEDRVPRGAPFSPSLALLRNRTSGESDKVNIEAKVTELERIRAQKADLEKPQMVYAGVFRKPDITFVLRRGDPEQRIAPIGPAAPEVLGELTLDASVEDPQRRMQLAKWIASSENPLTARVMVNRIWQYHFGRGIVATPSDFGVNGLKPSHPDLLDWLAGEFVRTGWSVKHIHRLILHSQTYRQQSTVDAESRERDNRWLWRFPSRRLEAEAIRDSLLFVSGELNLKMGGPGFNFFKTRGGLSGFPPVDSFTAEELRRMIYSHRIRMESTPVFGAFDCPDAGQPTPTRSRSTTAIQALNLFNSPFVVERALRFASRIESESGDDADEQANAAFRLALGRPPNDVEREAARTTIESHGLATLCRVLFNTSEFLFLP